MTDLISAHPHARFEQVTQACQVAEIHEVIERLPKGYQTEIGERRVDCPVVRSNGLRLPER